MQAFHPNDLSGWSPKYFPPLLVRYAARLLGLTTEE